MINILFIFSYGIDIGLLPVNESRALVGQNKNRLEVANKNPSIERRFSYISISKRGDIISDKNEKIIHKDVYRYNVLALEDLVESGTQMIWRTSLHGWLQARNVCTRQMSFFSRALQTFRAAVATKSICRVRCQSSFVRRKVVHVDVVRCAGLMSGAG